MKEGLRKSAAPFTCLLLSLSILLLPLFFSTASVQAGISPGTEATALQSADVNIIARIAVRDDHHLELLARQGVSLLGAGKPGEWFILTTYLAADQLRAEGWDIQVHYEADGKGGWRSLVPAGGCVYEIVPASRSFTAAGGTSSFDIVTTPECEWVVISSVPWVTVNGINQGAGNGTISFTVAQNDSPMSRSGVLFFSGQMFQVFQGAQFEDVPPGHPFYLEIGKISARGITVGCTGTAYCPNDPVTREQMAAFIMRALGEFNPPDPAMQRFADVPPSNIFYNFIDRLAELNITLGCGSGNFCPSQPVAREQMAAFLIRALGEFDPPEPAIQRFTDVPPTNLFYRFIDRLAALNITQGCGPNIYCPTDSVTRGQMAAFLVRAFNL